MNCFDPANKMAPNEQLACMRTQNDAKHDEFLAGLARNQAIRDSAPDYAVTSLWAAPPPVNVQSSTVPTQGTFLATTGATQSYSVTVDNPLLLIYGILLLVTAFGLGRAMSKQASIH